MKIDYDSILRNRQFYENAVMKRAASIERAKIANEEHERLEVKEKKFSKLYDEADVYLSVLKRVLTAIDTEDRAYKNRRIDFINDLVTESLQEIFPEEDVRAELSYDFYRKTDASLTLIDGDGNEMIPDVCSGKLQQYLISFAAVFGIAKGLGVHNLYVDEAFGVAAPEVLSEVGSIIQKRVEDGMQVLMIAQNPGVYQDLPRREIELRKNPVSKSVEVKSVNDF